MPSRSRFDSSFPSTLPDTQVSAPSAAGAPPHTAQPWYLVDVVAYGSLVMPVGMAIALWFPDLAWHRLLQWAMLTHLALVLSFLGGLHWGIAMRYMATHSRMPTFHFIWGPVPGYVAWLSLMADARVALLIMMALTLWTYFVDHKTWPGSGLRPWMPLRRIFLYGTLAYSSIALLALSR